MSLFTLKTGDQEQYGPVEMETLRTWVREGCVRRNDSIYDHTLSKWVEAVKIPEILDLFHLENDGVPQPHDVSALGNNDSPAKTEVANSPECPEKEGASEVPPAKAPVAGHLTPRPVASSAKLKIQKMLKESGQVVGADGQVLPPNVKPPSVLDRISRIFLLPFTRKKTDKDHSHGEKKP